MKFWLYGEINAASKPEPARPQGRVFVNCIFGDDYMEYTYKTRGTCSRQIKFDLVDGKVSNVSFVGGCNGNLQGISLLVEGMEASKVIEILKDIDCNGRGTSCPAQLARALKEAVN